MGLEGDIKHEWINYTQELRGARIYLNEEKYALVWSWDTKLGHVSAKHAYKAL
jgi:hypothetical protein